MKSSSTRRVLKSVVGPALGATLGALVAAGGCAKEEAKPTPTTTQPAEPAKAEPAKAAEPTPTPAEPVKAEPATPVEAEKPAGKEGAPDAGATKPPPKTPPKKDKTDAAKAAPGGEPKKEAAPPAPDKKKEEPKKSPSTEWYAGTMLERDIRPMRPARRGTDATVHALLTGLHDPALRPLS